MSRGNLAWGKIGHEYRMKRHSLRLAQREVAEALKVTQQLISELERGKSPFKSLRERLDLYYRGMGALSKLYMKIKEGEGV